ncbi:MAG: type II toxin-antitoxin system MqsA family antitoxin [Phycisphaerales bacterium]|nr:type II toxin-antitoxin system MqsA family antitoxin [Phycisphaerales bacterium]
MARLRCDACGKRQMHRTRIDYSYEISHDGRTPVTIRIPDLEVIECGNPECDRANPDHSLIIGDESSRRITLETYRQLGLLTPDEIRAGREKLGLNQQELQTLLGLGGNSLSRWENGRVYQSRAMDTLLRLVFEHEGTIEFVRSLRGEAAPPERRPTPRVVSR